MGRKNIVISLGILIVFVSLVSVIFFSDDDNIVAEANASMPVFMYEDGELIRIGTVTYFRDADGDTNWVMNDSGDLIGGFYTHDLSLSAGTGVMKALAIITDSTNASVLSLGAGGGVTSIYSNKSGSGTALPLAVGIDGTELMRLNASSGLLLGLTTTDISGNPDDIVMNGALNIASASADASVFGMSVAGGFSNFYSNKSGSGTALGIKFFVDGTEYAQLQTDGWFDRQEIWSSDIIGWFPPADSGAILDTLDSVIEVLNFQNTDSVWLTNTFQIPIWADQVDSFKLYVENPNTDGDSAAFDLYLEYYGPTEKRTNTFSLVASDTNDMSTTADSLIPFVFTGFSGISGSDILDFKIKRDTSITNNLDAGIPGRRTEMYFK